MRILDFILMKPQKRETSRINSNTHSNNYAMRDKLSAQTTLMSYWLAKSGLNHWCQELFGKYALFILKAHFGMAETYKSKP